MDKIYVVYWSQSGNTQAMAEGIGKGITDGGKEAAVVNVADAAIDELKGAKRMIKCQQIITEQKCRRKWSCRV